MRPFALLLSALAASDSDSLLEQPVRKRLWGLIRRQPGIHASALCRESGEAWGTVQYHLSLLRKGDVITSLEAGRERRFFPNDVDERRAKMLSVLHQGRREEIARFIRAHPGMRQVDVCEGVNVSRKTFRASIQPLVDAGLVRERKGLQMNQYFPEERLAALLPEDRDVV